MEMGPFSLSNSLFSLPLYGRSPSMTEILLTGTLSLIELNNELL